jgi:hypothetical protein
MMIITEHDARSALSFEAPFLIEKLLKEHIVETEDEGEALFLEVKRYIVANHLVAPDAPRCSMYSLLVDEAWHQFVLFTREYTDFSLRHFGRFIHHEPSNAPKAVGEGDGESSPPPMMTIAEFEEHYRASFGVALPDVWYDERNVRLNRRVSRERTAMTVVRAGDGMVDVLNEAGEILLSVNEMALPALEFLTRTPTFFARELPGELTDEEKLGLVSTFVELSLLRVAA